MEMAMRRGFSLMICILAAAVAALEACGPRLLSPLPADLTFPPGHYVQESYFAPNFKPEDLSYELVTFAMALNSEAPWETFLKIFQEELVRAWRAQGLKVGPGENAGRLSGTIQHLALRGAHLRWLTGRLHAELTLTGTITRRDEVLFAFKDQVNLSSPLVPGLAAPKEQDLLLRQLAREAVHRILNEMLLHGATGMP